MYINITNSETANNKGSSDGLVNYLEKENRLYNGNDPENWFNHQRDNFEPFEVRHAIDQNIAKLGKTDAKFFLINVSPSQKEILHLQKQYGEAGAKNELKKYAEKVMDEYAKNFKRNGVAGARDLVWFGKVEHYRYYSYKDKEVMNGTRKRGESKEGQQMHVQIVVSRKDATNKIKLSPMNNSKGRNELHSKKLGQFNRVAFKQSGEALFDRQFGFERNLNETMSYANIQKRGSLKEREQLHFLEKGAEINPSFKNLMAKTAKYVSQHLFHSSDDMFKTMDKTSKGILEILFEPVYEPPVYIEGLSEEEKRRRRKKKAKEQGIQH
jgi:hypothetical protein